MEKLDTVNGAGLLLLSFGGRATCCTTVKNPEIKIKESFYTHTESVPRKLFSLIYYLFMYLFQKIVNSNIVYHILYNIH